MEDDTEEAQLLEQRLVNTDANAAQAFMYARRGLIPMGEAIDRIKGSTCPPSMIEEVIASLLGKPN